MRFARTLSAALLREIVVYALVGFSLFTVIVVLVNLMRRLGELTAVGFAWADLASVLGCLFAMFAPYAIPVAFLFGVLLTVGRWCADSELVAMRACGLGITQLVTPVAVFGLGLSLLTGVLLVDFEPQAHRALRAVLTDVASRGSILEPGKFKGLGKRVVFIRDRDRDNRLLGVMISDRSNKERPFTVFAESGLFRFDSETGRMHLELVNGDIHFEPSGGVSRSYRRITFRDFDYSFDVRDLFQAELRMTRPREMTGGELREVIARAERGDDLSDLHEQDPVLYRAQLQRRYALAFSPFLFAFAGVPLGIRRSRGARSWGALVCAGVVFAYYVALSLGEELVESGSLPALAGLWLPNLLLAAIAAWLLRRTRTAEF